MKFFLGVFFFTNIAFMGLIFWVYPFLASWSHGTWSSNLIKELQEYPLFSTTIIIGFFANIMAFTSIQNRYLRIFVMILSALPTLLYLIKEYVHGVHQ